MTVKLLAIDVDDTLITDELVIPRNSSGYLPGPGQGSPCDLAGEWQSTVPYTRELGLAGPLILYNGAMVRTVER